MTDTTPLSFHCALEAGGGTFICSSEQERSCSSCRSLSLRGGGSEISGSDCGLSGVELPVVGGGVAVAIGLGFSFVGEAVTGVVLSDISGEEGIVLACRIWGK